MALAPQPDGALWPQELASDRFKAQLRITLHLHPAGVSRAELDSLALWEQMDGEAEEDLEPYSYGTEGAALAEEGTLLHMNSDELLLLALPPLLLLGAPLIIRGTCRAHT